MQPPAAVPEESKAARDGRDLLAEEMTPQQVAEGQRRASAFVANPADKHPLPDSGKLKESVPDAVEALKARAQKGDADAQYDLGERYSKGDGVPLDRGRRLLGIAGRRSKARPSRSGTSLAVTHWGVVSHKTTGRR